MKFIVMTKKKSIEYKGNCKKKIYPVLSCCLKHWQMKIGQKLSIHFAKIKSYVYVILPISLGLLLQPLPIIYGLFINKGL
ncbi:hypothetical protein GT3570_04275 [Geobacillus thermoleovorans]|nr:hypothetical protein GT3570_04275 [Geobacillus thermoleovorans]